MSGSSVLAIVNIQQDQLVGFQDHGWPVWATIEALSAFC
jgi:hypothetical protein